MDFEWRALGPIIAPLAPGLGSLIGGLIPFPGGSYAGQKLGEIIAAKFGVPATPAAVTQAIQSNPNEVVLEHLRAVMEEAKVYWPALAEMEKAWAQALSASIVETNATMRLELQPELRHPFYTGWRPVAGWQFNFFCGLFGLMLAAAVVLYAMGNDKMLLGIERVQFIAGALLSALGVVVGVYVGFRSKDKETLIQKAPPAAPAALPSKLKK